MRKVKIILTSDVEILGKKGEIKEVRAGYFRNFLQKKGLAEIATPALIKKAEEETSKDLEKKKEKEESLVKKAKELNGKTFTFNKKAKKDGNLYAKLSEKEIAAKTPEATAKMIVLKKPIEKIGKYEAEVRISPKIKISVHLVVKKG